MHLFCNHTWVFNEIGTFSFILRWELQQQLIPQGGGELPVQF